MLILFSAGVITHYKNTKKFLIYKINYTFYIYIVEVFAYSLHIYARLCTKFAYLRVSV